MDGGTALLSVSLKVLCSFRAARYQMTHGPVLVHSLEVGDYCCNGLIAFNYLYDFFTFKAVHIDVLLSAFCLTLFPKCLFRSSDCSQIYKPSQSLQIPFVNMDTRVKFVTLCKT